MADTNSAVLTETLGVFEGATPLTTSEVADALDISRRSAYDRLDRLAERGVIATKKVGARGRVWWRQADDERRPTDGQPSEGDWDAVATAGAKPTRGHLASLLDDVPGMVYRCRNEPPWPMSYVSDGCREVTGYDPAAIVSGEVRYGRDVLHPDDFDHVCEAVDRGLAEDGEFTIQYRIRTPDGETRWVWERGHGIPDGDGGYDRLEGVITDITDQKTNEQRLREERDFSNHILKTVPSSIVVMDDDGAVVRTNDRAADRLGIGRRDGDSFGVGDVVVYDADGNYIPPAERPYMQVFETGEPVENWHGQIDLPGAGRRWISINAEPVQGADGEVQRVIATSSDVTKLKRQADQLARERDELAAELDEVFARIDDAFYALDEDFRFTYVNDRAEDVLGYEEAELLGDSVWDRFPEATETEAWDAFREALETQHPTTFEHYYGPLDHWVDVRVYPSESGLSVYFRDVTEHKQRERELEQYETVAQTASDVIVTIDTENRIQSVNPAVADVFGYDPRELVGESLTRLIPDRLTDDHQTAIQRYLTDGTKRLDWDYLEFPGVRADGTEVPLAISFSEYEYDGDRYFTGIVRDITERKERERTLQRQRERLAALNHLNAVVRDVNEALVRESTRSEMEHAVCQRLAASDSYTAAWVGGADPRANAVTTRVAAGEDWDGDPADGRPETAALDMATEAIRTKETQVVTDVADGEDWNGVADRHDVTAVAAIPIVHEETVYGVLTVYTDREGAFADEERAVIAQLGELIGHAIAAAERKRALMSDTVVELEFYIEDVLSEFGIEESSAGRIELNETVPVGGGDYLVYGRVTADAAETLERLTGALDHWASLTVLTDEASETRFELRLTEPPVVSTVAAHGGYVERATVEDGDYAMTIHLPQSVEVRRIIDAVEDAYPAIEMVARRQVARKSPQRRVERTLREDLTECQRAALEASYHSGFFEWPRDSDGAAVADSLGVSSPTFHQHLRAAERKLLDAILA